MEPSRSAQEIIESIKKLSDTTIESLKVSQQRAQTAEVQYAEHQTSTNQQLETAYKNGFIAGRTASSNTNPNPEGGPRLNLVQ